MKKVSLAAAVVMMLAAYGFCADSVPVKLSLFPGVETSPSSKNLEGFGLGILGAKYQEATGYSFSLIWTSVKGDLNGANASYIYSGVKGTVTGEQGALVAISRKVSGAQGGLYTQAQELSGMQFGIVNNARKMSGIQVGIVNVTGELRGIQLGIVNVASKGGFAPVMVILNAGF